MAWIGVITNAGNVAIEQSIASGTELNVNAVKVGTGYISPALMRQATALSNQVGDGILENKESVSTGVRITASIISLSSAARIKEVGVFATIGGNSVLIALYQNSEGIDVPDVDEFPDYSYTLSAIWDIDNTEYITITVDPDALVTRALLDEEVEALSGEIEALSGEIDGKVDANQTSVNAGKFLGIGSNGNVTPTAAAVPNDIKATRAEIGIVVDGNKATQNVSTGDYVIVQNSTISGITDGLYKAAANVNAGTAFVSANLTSVSGGIGGELKSSASSLGSQILAINTLIQSAWEETYQEQAINGNTDGSFKITMPSGVDHNNVVAAIFDGYVVTSSWDTRLIIKYTQHESDGWYIYYRVQGSSNQTYRIWCHIFVIA